ncbi:hypothetical protein EG68_01588 [Paragonimus skrjabini miyazakii]|uniref:Uncharacterized protein n=1 Tax=Paragonimus skrjabini miyazakii TaxID=59628 RepID=A0A8S9Z1Y4_9TREM|nr:hypothetical protein EG68_01588 [Paragonimus skrjabini miyazakii]
MKAVPVVISLLVLLDGVLAQDGSAPRTFTSEFSGLLIHGNTRVREPEKLVQENKTMQVQTDVCSQITSLVPWYQAQKNTSTCTIKIGKLKTFVNYTILATDDFLRTYDPSCVTYDILLANQVRLSSGFRDKYYLQKIVLETRNRTQPVGPSDIGSTTIRVDGPLYKRAGWLSWSEISNFDNVTREVGENVRRQFAHFLNLQPSKLNHINTERRQIYNESTDKKTARMEAQITFNNSRLVAEGINYTCPPFKELVKATLNSNSFYSHTSYLWRGVNILEEKSDGRSADTTTASLAPDQTSANNGSVTTMRTTTSGSGAGINWCLVSIILPVITLNFLPAMH